MQDFNTENGKRFWEHRFENELTVSIALLNVFLCSEVEILGSQPLWADYTVSSLRSFK